MRVKQARRHGPDSAAPTGEQAAETEPEPEAGASSAVAPPSTAASFSCDEDAVVAAAAPPSTHLRSSSSTRLSSMRAPPLGATWMSAASLSLLLLLLLPLLQVRGASQFPGLPVAIDSASLCCGFSSLLPRDKLIFTDSMGMVWEYDAIEQQALLLYDTVALFSPPVGTGLSVSCDKPISIGRINASTWWTPDRPYFFGGLYYWRWTRYDAARGPQTPSSPSIIKDGWLPGYDDLDGWLTAENQWSFVFKGNQVSRCQTTNKQHTRTTQQAADYTNITSTNDHRRWLHV